ncbi:MAG: hypothetical protein ACSHX8_04120 [Opitutaceae bacterium]
MFKQNIIALLFACLLLPQISAQSAEELNNLHDLPPAEEGDLLCRCISTFLPKKDETYYFKLDNTYHEVALVGEGISMPFPVRKSNTFTLYSQGLSEEGAIIYIPVVQQTLDGSGGNYLIILSRQDNGTSLSAKTYNINTQKFPADSLHLLNQTEIRLGAQVDKVNAVVEPFDVYTHKFKDVSRDTYTSAKIAISYKGEAKVMSSKRLRLVPGRRFIMVCFPSKARAAMGATPLRVITLQDMP